MGDSSTPSSRNATDHQNTGTGPVALVYRGPAACEDCPESLAALLQSSQWKFNIKYVGPRENLSIAEGLKLPNVKLYAQPAGYDDVNKAYRLLKSNTSDIQNFVQSGGRYLGFCMGAYLAGNPGFNLLANYGGKGDTGEYRGTDARSRKNMVLNINWQGNVRSIIFQNGPYFDVSPQKVTTLATYNNGQIAVMVAPYGQGKIGLTGPHLEARLDWYQDSNLPFTDNTDFGRNLIDTLMQ